MPGLDPIEALRGRKVSILTVLPGVSYVGTLVAVHQDGLVIQQSSGPVLVFRHAMVSIRESDERTSGARQTYAPHLSERG